MSYGKKKKLLTIQRATKKSVVGICENELVSSINGCHLPITIYSRI